MTRPLSEWYDTFPSGAELMKDLVEWGKEPIPKGTSYYEALSMEYFFNNVLSPTKEVFNRRLTQWFLEAIEKEKDMTRSDVFEAVVIELPEEKFFERISSGKRRDLCKLLTPSPQIVIAGSLEEAKKKIIVQWLTDPSMRGKLVDPERLEVLCRPF